MKTAPFYVLAAALAIPAVLVGLEIPSLLTIYRQTLAWTSDLRVFYTPGYMLRTGQRKEIYDFDAIRRNQAIQVANDDNAVPYLHPAYEAVIFMPLSLLRYRVAYVVWAAVNIAVLVLIYFLVRDHLPDLTALGPRWILPALLLGFMPVAFTIIEGQDSLFLLLVLVVVYRTIRLHEFKAGLLLGLGMFRFQILLPIVFLFLLWKSLKFVFGWICGTTLVVALSAAITGFQGQVQYVKLLGAMGQVSMWTLLRRMPNLRALLSSRGFGSVTVAAVSLLVVGIAYVVGVRHNSQSRLALAISVSAFVPYYLFFHDASILVLPILLAMNSAIAHRNYLTAAASTIVLIGFAAFWFTNGKLYLGCSLSLLFFATIVTQLWREPRSPNSLWPLLPARP